MDKPLILIVSIIAIVVLFGKKLFGSNYQKKRSSLVKARRAKARLDKLRREVRTKNELASYRAQMAKLRAV